MVDTPAPTPSPAPEPTPAAPWHNAIADESLKGVASKFESREKLADALGIKADFASLRSGIKDEKLREHASRFTSFEDLVKGNVDLRSERDRLKGTAIVPPGKDSKPEEVAAYRKALGIPEAPDKYEWPDLPNGQQVTEEVKASRAAWGDRFHKLGVPATAAKELARMVNEDQAAYQAQLLKQDKDFTEKTETALKEKWGGDFERNTKASERAIVALAEKAGVNVDDLRHMETKEGRFLLDHPVIRQLFASVGLEMTEGDLGPALTEGERSGMKSQLETIRNQTQAAQAKGDSREANRLYAAEQALLAKMNGSRPIVGSNRAF